MRLGNLRLINVAPEIVGMFGLCFGIKLLE